MTDDQVKAVLHRVSTWPKKRQADLVYVVKAMEEQDRSELRLTAEQAKEVRRRLKQKNAKTLSFAQFKKNLHRRWGV